MYTKKLLSTAAAVAVIATGAVAFDSTTAGVIVTGDQNSSYGNANNTMGANALALSADQKGDALIYPFYRMTDGWETEIVVRNTSPHATVAKAVLYGQKDSEELVDFNIYLSPYDVARFTIKDGKITTKDGSFAKEVTNPKHGTKNDNANFNEHAGEEFTLLEFAENKKAAGAKGYVIIYGMTQYNDGDTRTTAEADLNYHKQHKALWTDYRRLLDDCRPGWRGAYTSNGTIAGMINGMMTVSVPAPDTNASCGVNDGPAAASALTNDTDANSTLYSATSDYNLSNFTDVNETTLVGTVRVSQPTDGASRDLLLPATALANFTDGNMLLWSEGEYASIQDRDIDTAGLYDEANITRDAATFMVKSAYYTYAKDSVANKLIVTQPLKRILVQLGNDNNNWQNIQNNFGGFKVNYSLFDEDEKAFGETITIGLGPINSPFNSSGTTVTTYDNEMEELENLEEGLSDTYFSTTDGFAYINFDGNATHGLPAVVTQMVGSKVNGVSQTNWIYAPTIK